MNIEKLVKLTERELEVFELMALGYSHKRVAEKLGISSNTASVHMQHVRNKLNAHKAVAVTLLAIKYGVLKIKCKK